jgi:UDP-N-acetylglucosamine 1-carboxyvinyltransferase
MEAVLDKLRDAGCTIETGDTWVRCRRDGPLTAFDIDTMPYPGFPTDMQAQLMAVATIARGPSVFRENIFENRYMHAAEMLRMGARIDVHGQLATVTGVDRLMGATVMASDLRASAALVLTALSAQGLTQVLRIYHLDRGYDNLVGKLRGVGARIARVSDGEFNEDRMRDAIAAP